MRSQTHLYRRGATYYWRRLIPVRFIPVFGARDLRLSLRTNIPAIARHRIPRLDAAFDALLTELGWIVANGQVITQETAQSITREVLLRVIQEADDRRLQAGRRGPTDIAAAVAAALEAQRGVQTALACNDLDQATGFIDPILARDGAILAKDNIEYLRLSRDVLVAVARAHGITAERENGNFTEIDSNGSAPSPLSSTPNFAADLLYTREQYAYDGQLLGTPFSSHAAALVRKKLSANEWGWDQQRQSEIGHRLLIDLIGDKPISQYTSEDAGRFLALLFKLPVGVGQRHPFRDATPAEAIGLADRLQEERTAAARQEIRRRGLRGEAAEQLLQKAKVQRIGSKNVIKYRDACNAVFKMVRAAVHRDIKNPFDGIRPSKRGKRDARNERPMYEDNEILKIFTSPIWAGCKSEGRRLKVGHEIIRDEKYWVPLIILFSGLRLEEVCQLWLEDFIEEDKIPCFKIWEGPGRQLKTKTSKRLVPIHDFLIELGLIEHAEKLREAGHERLFPDLERDCKVDPRTGLGKLGTSVSKSLGRYFTLLGLSDPGQALHALRHTVATKLTRCGVPEAARDDLLGHEQEGSEGRTRYVKPDPLSARRSYINLLRYDIRLVQRKGRPVLEPTAADDPRKG